MAINTRFKFYVVATTKTDGTLKNEKVKSKDIKATLKGLQIHGVKLTVEK